ncbi:MAG: hypothetical protein ABIQ93_04090 [Saprospiraceae bacterium]
MVGLTAGFVSPKINDQSDDGSGRNDSLPRLEDFNAARSEQEGLPFFCLHFRPATLPCMANARMDGRFMAANAGQK